MSPTLFKELSFVSPIIVKKSTAIRDPISPSERLVVTPRYLVKEVPNAATVAASYRISLSAVSRFITETCDAIWTLLKRMHYLDCPSNVSEWKSVAQEFESKLNFPHAVGALDGKHVVMQAPHNSGSAYFNYKKTNYRVFLFL